MYELGIFSIDDYRKDDQWLTYRLNQLDQEDLSTPLISRWSFETKDLSLLSYLCRLVPRATIFFCCVVPIFWLIPPGLLVFSRSGHLILDFVVDRTCYIYAKIKGKGEEFETERRLNQIFRTIAVAHNLLQWKERIESRLADPVARFLPETQKMYAYFCENGPIHNTLNRPLLDRVIQKTLTNLTGRELNILIATFDGFPNKQIDCIDLKERFSNFAGL